MLYIVMQERHPVDDLFRQGLAFAEVSPPAHVWAGIEEKRKRRFGAWRFWLVGAAALALVSGTIALTQIRPEASVGKAAIAQRNNATNGQPVVASEGQQSVSRSQQGNAITETTPPAEPALAAPAQRSSQGTPATAASALPARTATPVSGDPSPLGAERSYDAGISPLADASRTGLSLLELRPTDPTFSEPGPAAPRQARPTSTEYVLPRGWFWFSLQGGLYRTDLDHSGRDQGLAAAWNESLSPGTDMSIGLLGGRSWRSGFGLSVGAEYHSMEQGLSYSDQRDSTFYSTYTEVTVLDMVVLATSVDTFSTVIDQSVSGTGTQRTTAFVLPIEGFWHTPMRRWEAGVRFGLAWEHLRSTSDLVLYRPSGDADIALLSGPATGGTYTRDLISTSVGLDLGYHLTERWSFWLSPTYQRGLVGLQGDDPYQVLPERLGIRTRITFSLP